MSSRRSLLGALLLPGLPPAERIVLQLPEAVILRTDWSDHIDAPAQPGSLWKPFLAAAHVGPSPRFHCDGSRCWLGRSHGWLNMSAALAQSCNQWFHQLYETLPRPVSLLGLPEQTSEDWTAWRCSPLQLIRAYAELFARRADFPLVIAGLRLAAEKGTAMALGRGYLAKTGTGPSKFHAGDGWVVAASPAASPAKVILYRQRGATGAHAAAGLAQLLRREPL